uniref:Uncharacterized protein n=1 Tax=Chromera velia CCMP2878 TaxID=1169474 RepID=A0A0G4G412_9ALVE|eukprot:Cvel_20142.t1-p1 / transcript=Cvel_20142.t1 / gene=Cvel_20142 / organism=Chromera_velia_CCMP2878 / gene_product=hypothetical protein / transcript_product=hypothetical protein / location=Cvel_scaffold1787:23490-23825(+) / protein_length=71 / sequence_SO=supercontig / SO=protein_coding / is_pseudo=false
MARHRTWTWMGFMHYHVPATLILTFGAWRLYSELKAKNEVIVRKKSLPPPQIAWADEGPAEDSNSKQAESR